MNRINKMRTKNFLIVLCCIISTSMVLIIMGPSSVPANDSTIRTIFSQTNQQILSLKDSVVPESKNQLVIDDKYLTLLGYPPEGLNSAGDSSVKSDRVISSDTATIAVNSAADPPASSVDATQQHQNSKADHASNSAVTLSTAGVGLGSVWPSAAAEKVTNFSLVSYVLPHQLAAAVQLVKNLNAAVPNEHLLLYDLGLSVEDQRGLQKYCRSISDASSLNSLVSATSSSSAAASGGPSVGGGTGQPPVRMVYLYNEAGVSSSAYYAYSVDNNNSNLGALSSKCVMVRVDLVAAGFPSYVIDDAQMHAFRPLLVRDALRRWSRTVLFLENSVRLRSNAGVELAELRRQVEASASGVKGWRTEPTMAVSSRTHLKMYEYFDTDDDNFKFLKMLSLEALLFTDTASVNQRILLPWIKCALLPECIHPIGAQSNGCKLNKKPLYRYSGCHDYDASALNVVLGLTFSFDDQKYALDSDRDALLYTETLDESTRILEQARRNISETSDHPYTGANE